LNLPAEGWVGLRPVEEVKEVEGSLEKFREVQGVEGVEVGLRPVEEVKEVEGSLERLREVELACQ
jgi:hypothetical protein